MEESLSVIWCTINKTVYLLNGWCQTSLGRTHHKRNSPALLSSHWQSRRCTLPETKKLESLLREILMCSPVDRTGWDNRQLEARQYGRGGKDTLVAEISGDSLWTCAQPLPISRELIHCIEAAIGNATIGRSIESFGATASSVTIVCSPIETLEWRAEDGVCKES